MPPKKESKKELIEMVSKLLSRNFGNAITDNYLDFYDTRTEDVIIKSCRELLNELVGPKNAAKQMAEIYAKFKKRRKNE